MSSGQHELRIAVIGATGAVGGQIVELLGERGPAATVTLFASENSAAETVESGDRRLSVKALGEHSDLNEYELCFLAVPRSCAQDIVRAASRPIMIDLSAAQRSHADTPIVAPGLTAREHVPALRAQESRSNFAPPH